MRSHVGSEEQPGWYRVMDDLEFGLDIHELSDGSWEPFRCMLHASHAASCAARDRGHHMLVADMISRK